MLSVLKLLSIKARDINVVIAPTTVAPVLEDLGINEIIEETSIWYKIWACIDWKHFGWDFHYLSAHLDSKLQEKNKEANL